MATALQSNSDSAVLPPLDVARIREDFPVLRQSAHGHPLVYLDNAATTQKPRAVIDRLDDYYSRQNATVRRGVHYLSERSTFEHEKARARVAELLNAQSAREIVFVRGTTEAINLVAHGFGSAILGEADEVVVSRLEHHANIVPWQMACERSGARLVVAPIDGDGNFLLDEFERLLTDRTRIVAVAHVSNALGTVLPVASIVERAHARNIPVLIDGAQAVPHQAVDVRALDCDFYAFSGHKVYGPTGIGALYGKAEWLERLPPYQGGGDMILSVTFEKTTYNTIPHKFEAGTPAIADAIALATALDYVRSLGYERIIAHEHDLCEYAREQLAQIEGLRLIGTAQERAGVVSFVLEGVHPHDIGTILDQEGVAIRAGHHCAQPVMAFFGVPATARASFAFYNTREEVDALVAAVRRCVEVFS
jgi:cysteine desulfurase/selenocysteine lyase